MLNAFRSRGVSAAAALAFGLIFSYSAAAQVRFNLPAQSLSQALKDLALQAGVNIYFDPPAVKGLKSAALSAELSPEDALARLLRGTRLHIIRINESTFSVVAARMPRSDPDPPKIRLATAAADRPAPAPQNASQSTVQAQISTPQLGQILVTAERGSAQLAQNIPMSIVALTGAQLQRSGALTLEDIGHEVPGLSVVAAAPGQNTLIIRGVSSTGGSAPTVGFYIDDTPISVSTSLRGDTDPVLFDLERIEVLRGPQGTLYGASSEGGTVRYITNQPNLETFSGAAQETLSFTQGGGPNDELDGMVNLPLSPNVLALRASAVVRYYDGYIDAYPIAPTNILGIGAGPEDKNVNTEETSAARVAVEFKPNDSWALTPTIMYQRTLLGGTFTFDEPPGSFDHPIQLTDTNDPNVEQFTLLSLPVHVNMGLVHVVSSTSYYDGLYKPTEDNSAANYYEFSPVPQTYVYPNSFTTTYKTRVFAQEVRADATLGRVHGLIGVFYSHESDPAYYYWPVSAGYNAAFGTPFGNQPGFTQFFGGYTHDEINQLAVYGQFNIHITDQLVATIGDRAFRVTHPSIADFTGVYNGGSTSVPGNLKEQGTTPKYGLSYHLTPNAMLYASVSKGFRPGGSVTLPQTVCDANLRAIGLSGPPTSYNADDLWDYEIGEKFTSQPLRLSVDTTVFYIDWKDLQQSVQLPTCGWNFTGNFGAAVSKGVESEIHYYITRALDITVGTTFTQAQLTAVVAGTQGQVGNTLENVPKWMGNVSIEYHTAISPTISGFSRFDLSATSRQYNNFDATSIYYATGGYSLANFRLGVDTPAWEASFFISNLLNKHAETALPTAFGIDLPNTRAVSLNRPRTVGLEVRRDF